MKTKFLLLVTISFFLFGCKAKQKDEIPQLTWLEVESIPKSFGGISKGVSAAFTGILDGNLIVAGGCNFPGVPASEGGKKVYYRDILMLDGSEWKKIGELPEEVAYGVSVVTDDKLIFVGGQNVKPLKSVYVLSFENDTLRLDTLPSLPVGIDNASGTLHNNRIYVAGGNVDGNPSSDVWSFDLLNSKHWTKEMPLPVEGGLVQPVLVSQLHENSSGEKNLNGAKLKLSSSMQQLYLFGGFTPASGSRPAIVNQDVWEGYYGPKEGWVKSEKPFPSNVVHSSLSGGAGIAIQDSLILLLGGVNRQIFEDALNRNYYLSTSKDTDTDTLTNRLRTEAAEYLLHPVEWYRFNDEVWLYNVNRKEWKSIGNFPQAALAGASVASNGKEIYILNGEIKPGIRTPKIWKITF